MAELQLREVARAIGARVLQGRPETVFRSFNIDSRLTRPGELFFAVRGKRDGHDFISQAAQKGASGAVVSEDIGPVPGGFALLRVEDTVEALQALAAGVLRDFGTRVVGITGSIGKTTTKEFTAALLGSRLNVLKSEGNFNNHLGLALSLLKLRKEHQVAVLEYGMSASGEIRGLTRIAPPDVAVITNVAPVHLQFFGGLDGIAAAKKEILDGMRKTGIAVLNGDDARVLGIAAGWEGKRIMFGRSGGCDVQAASVRSLGYEGIEIGLKYGPEEALARLPFLNEDAAENLLAALGVCLALGEPLSAVFPRIAALKPFAMRGVLLELPGDVKVIDDSYNSNPRALASALRSYSALPSLRKVAVLADMLELGPEEKKYHLEAGECAARAGWDILVTIGPLAEDMARGARSAGMPGDRIWSFADSDEAAAAIPDISAAGDLILVKGSRGMKAEKVVEALNNRGKE